MKKYIILKLKRFIDYISKRKLIVFLLKTGGVIFSLNIIYKLTLRLLFSAGGGTTSLILNFTTKGTLCLVYDKYYLKITISMSYTSTVLGFFNLFKNTSCLQAPCVFTLKFYFKIN